MANNKLKHLLIVIFIILNIYNTQAYNLPEIGSASNSTLSYKDEKMLGEYIYADVQKELPLVSDPLLEDYIQKLGNKLVNNSNKHFESFQFFIVDSPDINAFALPGGYIAVNRGLITAADTESELAAVMAHEITHVNQRHIARSFEKQQQLQIPMIAGIIAGALLSAYSPEAGQSVIAGSMAASNQSLINYTRSNEEEADRIGMSVLAKSGYSPYSMGDFFNKLQRNAYADKDSYPEYLRTHPITTNRSADANSRADEILISKNKNKKFNINSKNREQNNNLDNTDNFNFALAKIMANNKNNSISNNKPVLISADSKNNFRTQDISDFRIAYSKLKNQDLKQANLIFKNLYTKYPDNQIITSLYAESFENNPQTAINILDNYLKNNKSINIPIDLQYASLAISNNNINLAIDHLKKITKSNYTYPPKVNLLLAESYNKANQKWQASLAYADYSIQKGDISEAIMQLKSTAKFDKLTDYQSKIINYRIKDLEAKYKERKEQIKAYL